MSPSPAYHRLAHSRVRDLISQLTNENFQVVSAQIVFWVNALQHSAEGVDRVIEAIYDAATSCNSTTSLDLLARTCHQIVYHTATGDRVFINHLLEKCTQEFLEAQDILDSQTETPFGQTGSWPQLIALLKFVGELHNRGMLQEDNLLNVYLEDMLHDAPLSDLRIEGLCTIIRSTGHTLDQGERGRAALDHFFKNMEGYVANECGSSEITRQLKEISELRGSNWTPPNQDPSAHVFSGSPPDYSVGSAPLTRDSKGDSVLYSLPRHKEFYLPDGLLSMNSPVFREKLAPAAIAPLESYDGCSFIYLSDSVEDFATLLRVIYQPGFPARHKTPDFPTFSAILRMTTKYEVHDIRVQLLVDLHEAYPNTFEEYEASTILADRIFGHPKPHPNTVLNLFNQCNVGFALPYAYYMACREGVSSLTDTTPDRSLPPATLAVAIRGLGELKAAEIRAVKAVLFAPKLHKCDRFMCYAGFAINEEKNGQRVFEKIYESIVPSSSDMATTILEAPKFQVEPPPAKPAFCDKCLVAWSTSHREIRRNVWDSLPVVFEFQPKKQSS